MIILKKKHPKDTIKSSGIWKMMALEMVLVMIVSPPGLDTVIQGTDLNGTYFFSINGIIFSLNLGKGYLVLRLY